MILPKVDISSDPQQSIDTIKIFLLEPNGFRGDAKAQIYADHPKLKSGLTKGKKAEKLKFAADYVSTYYQNDQKRIDQSVEALKSAWNKIGPDVLTALSEIMNTNWQGIETITWDVGIVQMYPRFLEISTFQTYYLQYPFQALSTALHEITHFIYFKKWAELFPEDPKETYECAHPFWHLSELLDEVINSDERLRVLIPDAEGNGYQIYRSKPYQEHKHELSQYGYFAKKYLENKKAGQKIDQFLREARQEALQMNFE